MPSTGFTLPGVGSNRLDAGSAAWANPTNIQADDSNAAATSTLAFGTTQGLVGDTFGFSLPTGSTIDGIEAQYKYKQDVGSTITTDRIKLQLADDSLGTTDKSGELTAWNSITNTDEVGGAADLWGETGLTETDINDADWGVLLGAKGNGSLDDCDVYFVKMNVHYTTISITDVNTTESWNDGDTGLVITGTGFTG